MIKNQDQFLYSVLFHTQYTVASNNVSQRMVVSSSSGSNDVIALLRWDYLFLQVRIRISLIS